MLGKSEPKKMCSLHGDVHPMVDWIRKNYIPLTNKSKHKVEVFRWQATQIPKPEWWQFWGISLTLKQNVSCPVLIHSRDYWSISFRWIWVENLKTCKKGKILEIYTLFVVEWKKPFMAKVSTCLSWFYETSTKLLEETSILWVWPPPWMQVSSRIITSLAA